jgi:amino acid transporter
MAPQTRAPTALGAHTARAISGILQRKLANESSAMNSPTPMRREVGTFALMLTGLGSIIGSGWLFGAWRAAGLAGPGAVWAWVLGAAIIMTIALTYAELGAMFPESGGMVRYSHFSHGSLVGFVGAWANWISIVSVIPVEAEASVQYMASWPYPWAQELYMHLPSGHGELTPPGLAIAAALVIVYFLLNFWSVKIFAHSNTAITIFKLVVPAATGVALIASGFHPENFHVGVHGQAHAVDFAAVLTAVATAGIVFSFNGFQSPVTLAGAARNPARRLPFAVLGSLLIAAVVYVLLQVAYRAPCHLTCSPRPAGMASTQFTVAQLALLLNLHFLAILLSSSCFVSPSGTGITYTASTARMIYGMERNGTLPRVLGRLHPLYGVPRAAMWLNLAVSFLFLFFFRGWGTLAAVISVATIISYLTGPVSAMTLRRTAAQMHRPLRLAGLPVIAALAFIFATELLYWAKWPLTGEIILLMVVALPVYLFYQARSGWPDFKRQLRAAWWLVVYLPIIAAVSWAGSARFGGHDYLTWGWDLLVVAVVGLVFFVWGVKSGWSTPAVQEAAAAHDARDGPARGGPTLLQSKDAFEPQVPT